MGSVREMLGKDGTLRFGVRSCGWNYAAGRRPGVPARKNRDRKDRPQAIGGMPLALESKKEIPVLTCGRDFTVFWLESSPFSIIQLLVGLDSFGGHHVAACTLS